MYFLGSEIRKELFTLSLLKYNMKIFENRDKKKFIAFAKQVDIQEYYLFQKYNFFLPSKKEKNIIQTLNHLSHQFYHPKSNYTVFNNGFIFYKEKQIYYFPIKQFPLLTFPKTKKNSNITFTKIKRIEFDFFQLHFLLLKSF